MGRGVILVLPHIMLLHLIHWLLHMFRRETVEFIHDPRPYDPRRYRP